MFKTEKFQVCDGIGLFKFGKNDSLLFNNQPITAAGVADEPTLVYYFIIAGYERQKQIEITSHINSLVQNKLNDNLDIVKVFEAIINLLPNGSYQYEYFDLTVGHTLVCHNESDREKKPSFYGGICDENYSELFFTQKLDVINFETVKFYKDQISNGKRPVIITLRNYPGFEYILDGHHKILAYNELTITPHILRFQNLDGKINYQIDDEAFKSFLTDSEFNRIILEREQLEW